VKALHFSPGSHSLSPEQASSTSLSAGLVSIMRIIHDVEVRVPPAINSELLSHALRRDFQCQNARQQYATTDRISKAQPACLEVTASDTRWRRRTMAKTVCCERCRVLERPCRSQTPRPRDHPTSRTRTFRGLPFAFTMALLLFASLLPRPASAAFIVAFDDCLPDSYRNYDPKPLQWVPLYVAASFDTEAPSHTLQVTVWGNVTGESTNVTLAPWNSTQWSNPNYTAGKILDEPDPSSQNPKITTLHTKVDVLSYTPFNTNTNFCNTSLANATCPLGPIFNTTAM
jgi:hypothetical protein